MRLFAALATLTIFSATLPAQATTKAAEKATPKVAAIADDKAVAKAKDKAAELKTIPGVGEAYSAAIIKGRPYANKSQLKSLNVVPDGVYEKIKDKIIARK